MNEYRSPFPEFEARFKHNSKKWQQIKIGDTVKVPFFGFQYNTGPKYKDGVVVDKEAPLTLIVNIEGEVREYTVSFIKTIDEL